MMRKIIDAILLYIAVGLGMFAAAQAPQIPLTGTAGPGGNFSFRNASPVSMTSDANHTMVYPEGSGAFVRVTSTVSLSATRNLIEPFLTNAQCFENATTGGQAIQVIGASGTGVTIPNGSYACVQGDGTNYHASNVSDLPFSAPRFVSGTPSAGALAALPSGAHGSACDESAMSGVPATGVDYSRCDSTTHRILDSYNNGAEAPRALVPTIGTSGHLAVFKSNGIDLQDGGVVPSGGVTQLTGDVVAGPGSGSLSATVKGLNGIPFCAGFSPSNTQSVTLTTSSSPNPCWTGLTASGSVTGQANNVVGLATSSTAIGAQSHINENTPGTTQVTQTLAATGGLVSGTPTTAALAALPSGAHGSACDESAMSGVPATGVDYSRCDSTTHRILDSYNNGAEAPRALVPTIGTSGHLAVFKSNGIDLQDGGAVPSGGINQLTGDGTAGPGIGSQALTLATVNGSPGACGDSTHVCQITTNGKGLTTSQSQVAISGGQYYWSFPSYGSDGSSFPVSAVYYLPNGLSSVSAQAVGRFNGTCTSYPVMTILDLGTSASSTSGTTLLTLTFTTSGVVTTSGTVTVASGHYLGISTTDSIACSVQNDLDVTMTY